MRLPCGLVHFQELWVWRESGWTFTCSDVTPALLSLEVCGVVPGVPQSYLLVHRIAHWSQVAVLYGCVKFLVSGFRCHQWFNARKPCDDYVTVHRITCEGVLEVL